MARYNAVDPFGYPATNAGRYYPIYEDERPRNERQAELTEEHRRAAEWSIQNGFIRSETDVCDATSDGGP